MEKLLLSKTRTVIATELAVDRSALQRMLCESGINLPAGPVYLPWQKLIYETFGYPEGVESADFQMIIAAERES